MRTNFIAHYDNKPITINLFKVACIETLDGKSLVHMIDGTSFPIDEREETIFDYVMNQFQWWNDVRLIQLDGFKYTKYLTSDTTMSIKVRTLESLLYQDKNKYIEVDPEKIVKVIYQSRAPGMNSFDRLTLSLFKIIFVDGKELLTLDSLDDISYKVREQFPWMFAVVPNDW